MAKIIALVIASIFLVIFFPAILQKVAPDHQPPHIVDLNKGFYEFDKPRDFPDVRLVNQNSEAFQNTDVSGHWSLVVFGFTQCPSVCPVSMKLMSDVLKVLKTHTVKGVLVSVDPKHDTPDIMKTYLKSFHPGLIGLTGQIAMIEKLAQSAATSFDKQDNQIMAISHSSSIYLMNDRAQFVGEFTAPRDPLEIAKIVVSIMKGNKSKS